MTDARALVRGLGATAAVLGALALVVGAPVRARSTTRDTVISAATRDALDCARGDSEASSPASGANASSLRASEARMSSFRASEASRGICTSPNGAAVSSDITAIQLAQWIRDGKPGLRVIDLRDSSAFGARHVPSAEWRELMGLSEVLPRAGETLVLYSDDDLRDVQGVAWLTAVGHARVYVVRGGMSAWMTEVIDPVVHGDSAAMVASLSRYFGGVPRAAAASVDSGVARGTIIRARAQARNATDEFGFAARRGC